MAGFRVISSDSHVVEPPNLWLDRMDAGFGENIPHLEVGDPYDWWVVGQKRIASFGATSGAGLRFDTPEKIRQEGSFANVRPGGYIPDEHVKDMELDGVYGGVVYPSLGLGLFGFENAELARPIFSTYNDWVADFCESHPQRLKGVAMIILDDGVTDGIAELRRAADRGLAGAMISSFPRSHQTYDLDMYEPFWAAAEEVGLPISLHVTTNRPGGAQVSQDGKAVQTGADRNQYDYWVRMSLSHIIYAGVLERYPDIKLVSVEHELGWIPYFISRLDSSYIEREYGTPYRFQGDTLPSDFMSRNVFHSFQEDALGIQLRHMIGVDNLLWGSDYPHAESTFPKSRDILDSILDGVPEDEQAKIVGGNAARIYRFD